MTKPNPFTAFEYFDFAEQFYNAFGQLPNRQPISWPRYFLLCHSIELSLKAYLAKFGATPNYLRELERRHKLNKLLDEVVQKGLHLTTPTQEGIKALAEAHSNHWHRYPRDDGKIKVFLIEQFNPAARELINEVCKEVRGVALEELER